MGWWLSYGGGVNSTALAVLCLTGRMREYKNTEIIFADTLTEKAETYLYIERVFEPWLRRMGKELIRVAPAEGVLERWERLGVTGSRLLRTCTVHGKIKPLERHILTHDANPVSLVGIDAGEPGRIRPPHKNDKIPKIYPLYDAGIDRRQCYQIIQDAGLCPPPKSGCWCCPFLRTHEILELARTSPGRMGRIARIEQVVAERYPDKRLWHFRDKPITYWVERARLDGKAGTLDLGDEDMPCSCYDGG